MRSVHTVEDELERRVGIVVCKVIASLPDDLRPLANARALGIDLGGVTHVVLSEYLNLLGLERLVLLHCTGEAASTYLAQHVHCSVSVGQSGDSWEFWEGKGSELIDIVALT